jgi:hypothetical protein
MAFIFNREASSGCQMKLVIIISSTTWSTGIVTLHLLHILVYLEMYLLSPGPTMRRKTPLHTTETCNP